MIKLKESGIEWIGSIPEHWEVVRHKNIMKKEKNICFSYNNEDILSLTMKGVIKRDLDNPTGKMPSSFDGYQYVEPNNLLLCLFDIDVTPRCVGLIRDKGLTSPAYSQFKLINGDYAPYYNYLLTAIDDKKSFLHLSKNLRSSLTEDDFGSIKTIRPSYDEQVKISEFLDKKCVQIDKLIDLQEKEIEELKGFKQKIIHKAVSKGIDEKVEYKETGIKFIEKIPKHWQLRKILYSFETMGSGTTPKSSDDMNFEGENNWIQSGDLGERYLTKTKSKISDKALNSSSLTIYKAPFIVIAMYGASIGNVSISKIDACTNQACCVLVNPKPDTLPEFIYYVIIASKERFAYLSNGGGQPNISQEIIRQFRIPFPSREEQEKIVKYLDFKCNYIEGLLKTKKEKIEELKNYKKSLIFEYVTGKKEI